MSPNAVQDILQDFVRRARRVGAKRFDGSEVWRFSVDDHVYDLHYYPDDNTFIRRKLGGADAAREFTQLQALQKLGIPATRVIANLKGFRIGDRKGDACIVVHDPNVVPLRTLLRDRPPVTAHERLEIMAGVVGRLEEFHRQKLCPQPLGLDRFGRRGENGPVILTNGRGTMSGLVDPARLNELDAATRHVTSASERLRIWRHFSDEPAPRRDRALAASARRVARAADSATSAEFGAIEHDGWSGVFARRIPFTLGWSQAIDFTFDADAWTAALPRVFDESQWTPLKDDRASRVVSGTLSFEDADGAPRQLAVVVKRPAVKRGLHGVSQRLRRSRARRAWLKAWRLLAAGFACEVPLLLLERRRGPLLVDQLVVFERVPGPTLAEVDLDALPQSDRDRLLAGCGRVVRKLERAGFRHTDAKDTNWIAWTDSAGRSKPVMIDLDGVRRYGSKGVGVPRLIASMRKHSQLTDADVASIQRGYRDARG